MDRVQAWLPLWKQRRSDGVHHLRLRPSKNTSLLSLRVALGRCHATCEGGGLWRDGGGGE